MQSSPNNRYAFERFISLWWSNSRYITIESAAVTRAAVLRNVIDHGLSATARMSSPFVDGTPKRYSNSPMVHDWNLQLGIVPPPAPISTCVVGLKTPSVMVGLRVTLTSCGEQSLGDCLTQERRPVTDRRRSVIVVVEWTDRAEDHDMRKVTMKICHSPGKSGFDVGFSVFGCFVAVELMNGCIGLLIYSYLLRMVPGSSSFLLIRISSIHSAWNVTFDEKVLRCFPLHLQ